MTGIPSCAAAPLGARVWTAGDRGSPAHSRQNTTDIFRMVTRLGVAVLIGMCAQVRGADLSGEQSQPAGIALGKSVFETQWVAAGMPAVSGRTGLGPLFNASSCNACHDGGDRGSGPAGDGPVPTALVIQLGSPPASESADAGGDRVYGRVLNTQAVGGLKAEGAVTVEYSEVTGYYYPFGGQWTLRVPRYRLSGLSRGPLAPRTVIKPRLAPALFGVGLLESVPASAIAGTGAGSPQGRTAGTLAWQSRDGTRVLGRLGWQDSAVSIRDQVANAFAREMGLTSPERASDDCTAAEVDCPRESGAAAPEVAANLLDAVVAYLRTLAVPEAAAHAPQDEAGAAFFRDTGCASCHRPEMPVELRAADGTSKPGVIAPYTDLRLHDLGTEMADETVSGEKVASRWRTAPLWGLGHRLQKNAHATFLHDGRARSIEEAILWHGGEAAYAKRKFGYLGPRARENLLDWIAAL
ncbi:MAG: hypothetical protein JSR15_01415 [Proteobacteria bacterium]|nr:hypothetical protein [Pseudomonadota bacterium]